MGELSPILRTLMITTPRLILVKVGLDPIETAATLQATPVTFAGIVSLIKVFYHLR
jgi:hypothetical protein